MSLNLKFWGVRGSLPTSLPPKDLTNHIRDVMRNFFNQGYSQASDIDGFIQNTDLPMLGGYGTCTTCVEIQTPEVRLIIDGGSGIRNLGESMMSQLGKKPFGPIHIYMTHFHWDHIIGLPFFSPHFVPGVEIHYYAVHDDLESHIRSAFQKPYFPVPFEDLRSKIHFHKLTPRQPQQIGDMTITPYLLDHPDPCWGLKVESGGKVYAHCMDTEANRVTREELGEDLPLYQNVDLMYFDAQYTLPELVEKANWGHSAAQVGLDIAIREKISRVLFAHHDPGAFTMRIQELKRQTDAFYKGRQRMADNGKEKIFPVSWDFAHEGLEINL